MAKEKPDIHDIVEKLQTDLTPEQRSARERINHQITDFYLHNRFPDGTHAVGARVSQPIYQRLLAYCKGQNLNNFSAAVEQALDRFLPPAPFTEEKP